MVNDHESLMKNTVMVSCLVAQSPFYDVRQPAYVKYASIGGSIGHELMHGLDGTCAGYDEQGKEKDWWTAETKERHKQPLNEFIERYNSYDFHQGFVNGSLTAEENIADEGGLKAAYIQHCMAYTPEFLKVLLKDEHSPGKLRVIGPLSVMKELQWRTGALSGHLCITRELYLVVNRARNFCRI
ncbi:putative Endothelin-converting enzyme 1 [Hypsibius exemplaris]|uniref:Endothelin-converting enzyme 1 n=1 Tax=Hypsibius exemplaris TaxID=2072580 RepID=A0A9X6NAQ8_HYPEX|nr:putative Endothelin-converting enzyme 1 [Hypsibius exemplaris]